MNVKEVNAREILDSRGDPTVEVDLIAGNFLARASVPHGTSGEHRTHMHDNDKRYHGKGVQKAVNNIHKYIRPHITGKSCKQQAMIDQQLLQSDGTHNKRDMGVNALLGVSMAACRAGAHFHGKHLYQYISHLAGLRKPRMPKLMFTMINGGEHAGNELMVKECLLVPKARHVADKVRIASEVYHELKSLAGLRHGRNAMNIGDHGGIAPPVKEVEDALNMLVFATQKAGHKRRVDFALNCGADYFCRNGRYFITRNRHLSGDELHDYYNRLAKLYPIYAFEDPFHRNDVGHFHTLNKKLRKTNIIMDNATETNRRRIKLAADRHAADTVSLRLSHVGTVTEALQAARAAREHKWNILVSDHGGETTDDFTADFAVGIGAEIMKAGAPARGERVAKYNQLLRIEEQL